MVVSVGKPNGRPSRSNQEECQGVAEVLEKLTHRRVGGDVGLVIKARRLKYDWEKLREDGQESPLDHNLRVDTVSQLINYTGCTPDQAHMSSERRTVVVDCPSDQSLRCAECIMSLECGSNIVESLKEKPRFFTHIN